MAIEDRALWLGARLASHSTEPRTLPLLLEQQLRQFPLGAHDDGPDALEMAVTEAVEYRVVKTTGGVYA